MVPGCSTEFSVRAGALLPRLRRLLPVRPVSAGGGRDRHGAKREEWAPSFFFCFFACLLLPYCIGARYPTVPEIVVARLASARGRITRTGWHWAIAGVGLTKEVPGGWVLMTWLWCKCHSDGAFPGACNAPGPRYVPKYLEPHAMSVEKYRHCSLQYKVHTAMIIIGLAGWLAGWLGKEMAHPHAPNHRQPEIKLRWTDRIGSVQALPDG